MREAWEKRKGSRAKLKKDCGQKIEETQEKLSHRVTSRTLRKGEEEGGARGRHSKNCGRFP